MPTLHYPHYSVTGDGDLMEWIRKFCKNHPVPMFAMLFDSNGELYLHSFASARSHVTARNRALRAHEKQGLPRPEYFFVFGRCRNARCRCGGRAYIKEGRWRVAMGWCEWESHQFRPGDFSSMLAYVRCSQRALSQYATRGNAGLQMQDNLQPPQVPE